MTTLTNEQKAFLKRLDIPLWRIFDAAGIQRKDFMLEMAATDKWIAIGTNPCTKAGHTMKTRSGHCPQCDTKQLGFLTRFDETGEVYIAQSKSGKLLKIGFSANAESRLPGLNSYAYGGVADWKMMFVLPCKKANRVETVAHGLIAQHRVPLPAPTYFKEGREVECRELFVCRYSVAESAVRQAIANVG
jgi:hypothetical protein